MEEKLLVKITSLQVNVIRTFSLVLEILIFQYIWVKRPEPLFHKQFWFFNYSSRLSFFRNYRLGISQSNGVFELASRVNRIYAYIFTILLYLVIGPFFALPRLATTSFEIGISPFLSHELQLHYWLFLVSFSLEPPGFCLESQQNSQIISENF